MKTSKRHRDEIITVDHTRMRKARAIAKRCRYYKTQPPGLLKGLSDELSSLVNREIERWREVNGKK